jgi:integrase/recombinase XerD
MNRQVNITKRVQTADGLRYCPAFISPNGRIKPNVVMVDEKQELHPEGAYYLDWREGKKRVRLSVGKDAAYVLEKRSKKEAELNAVNHGIEITPEKTNGRSLSAAIDSFLEDTKLKQQANKGIAHHGRGRHNTLGCYTTALNHFQESCTKANLEDIDRRDLLKFSVFLVEEKKHAPMTVYNKFQIVVSFLKSQGITKLVSGKDWPKYTPKAVQVYEQDEIDKLFAACTDTERLWFQFFLETGMRKDEVAFCYKSDINFSIPEVSVTAKHDLGWSPKTYQERAIPLTDNLAAKLKLWIKESDKQCKLLFPTSGGLPKRDFLDVLKRVAEDAGLEPKDFWLHKFRATYCTRGADAGFSLPTAQDLLGHKDPESTMRYMKSAARSPETRAKINAIFAKKEIPA